jgi:hypothetical protein
MAGCCRGVHPGLCRDQDHRGCSCCNSNMLLKVSSNVGGPHSMSLQPCVSERQGTTMAQTGLHTQVSCGYGSAESPETHRYGHFIVIRVRRSMLCSKTRDSMRCWLPRYHGQQRTKRPAASR